jgi:hypothetical protein
MDTPTFLPTAHGRQRRTPAAPTPATRVAPTGSPA